MCSIIETSNGTNGNCGRDRRHFQKLFACEKISKSNEFRWRVHIPIDSMESRSCSDPSHEICTFVSEQVFHYFHQFFFLITRGMKDRHRNSIDLYDVFSFWNWSRQQEMRLRNIWCHHSKNKQNISDGRICLSRRHFQEIRGIKENERHEKHKPNRKIQTKIEFRKKIQRRLIVWHRTWLILLQSLNSFLTIHTI